MARLTVRLPESLHKELEAQAEREGVSLNQYIVFSLTRSSSVATIEVQRREFEALRSRFPEREAEDALRRVLADRAPSQP